VAGSPSQRPVESAPGDKQKPLSGRQGIEVGESIKDAFSRISISFSTRISENSIEAVDLACRGQAGLPQLTVAGQRRTHTGFAF